MNSKQSIQAKSAVKDAAAYLRTCGIRLPRFRITTEPAAGRIRLGGSFVDGIGGSLRLNMGYYPRAFHRHWFAMHELGHVLWEFHQPLRSKNFKAEFGDPRPDDYDDIHTRESWKTAATGKLSWFSGPHRPAGQPSWYGTRGGGEERFCELLGFMFANGDFSKPPPDDIANLWDICWESGLARMT